jgi:hypothetical protein
MQQRSTRKPNGAKSGKSAKASSARGNGAGKNTRWNAEHRVPYVPENKPGNVKDLVDTLNMWSCYFKYWGKRMETRVSTIEHKLGIEPLFEERQEAPGRGTTHLDPPPDEPYTPAPS